MTGDVLEVLAPLSGWVSALDEVADPVFAERMLGDGMAIDPTGAEVRAPFGGEVISLHAARHAVGVRAAGGAEVLIHLGLETVALEGRGIAAHVAVGDRVQAGQLMLSFDMDAVAHAARSLVTPVIVTNGELFSISSRAGEGEIAAGQVLMTLHPVQAAIADPAAGGQEVVRVVRVPLRHGIHARPAGQIAACARRFNATVELRASGRIANAASPLSLMALGIRFGEEVTLVAQGADAALAVDALAVLILEGLPEADSPAPPPPAAPAPPMPVRADDEPGVLHALTASPGFAVGPVVQWRREQIPVAATGQGPTIEAAALEEALAAARAQLRHAIAGHDEGGDILAAHLAMLDDPEITAAARALVDEGASAGAAWRGALDDQRQALAQSGDPRIAERVTDLDDLERRVLRLLAGLPQAETPALPDCAILVADELLPSELLAVGPGRLGGVCTVGGGPTCHMAIIAQALGVPAVVAASPTVLQTPAGEVVVLDADAGLLRTGLTAEQQDGWRGESARRTAAATERRQAASLQARLADGTRIEVFANLGGVDDATLAVANGAEGCGLLRTEFLFLSRQTAPDEDEQLAVYQAVADALEGRPLIVRTLDIGADKPAPYLPMPHEANPALGVRGVRISLQRPDLLRTQLRAILRVRPAGVCRIMVPMIASADELAAVRAILDEERAALEAEPIELGAMIETPAAAIAADLVAAEADFLSVGSNDLTQYTLAMDREHPQLAAGQDGLHPAVLRLIEAAAKGAAAEGRWLGVCGGLASDPAAALILVGLGVTELSAAPAAVPAVKAALRGVTLQDCQTLAAAAVAAPHTAAVRRLARDALARSEPASAEEAAA